MWIGSRDSARLCGRGCGCLFEAFSEVLGVVEELEEGVGVDLVGDVELVWGKGGRDRGKAAVPMVSRVNTRGDRGWSRRRRGRTKARMASCSAVSRSCKLGTSQLLLTTLVHLLLALANLFEVDGPSGFGRYKRPRNSNVRSGFIVFA